MIAFCGRLSLESSTLTPPGFWAYSRCASGRLCMPRPSRRVLCARPGNVVATPSRPTRDADREAHYLVHLLLFDTIDEGWDITAGRQAVKVG